MATPYYAHSLEGQPQDKWQRLEDHLRAVAEKARDFASVFNAGEWAYLAGLWHDLGKYSEEFQAYLRSQSEASAETQPGRVDHSTASAQYANEMIPLLGHLLAYALAGHHSGLLDGRAVDACQERRLDKSVKNWRYGLSELPAVVVPSPPEFVQKALGRKDAFSIAFFVRMVFSCLVDADFLDTERFMDGGRADARDGFPDLGTLAPPFFQSLGKLERDANDTEVNRKRRDIRAACERAADMPRGFFSLTVPTGGGKTLASLAFALRHTQDHGLRRLVYVAPFTSIIEQNADVFRRHLGKSAVLEHHCNLDPEEESLAGRLAAENWDAPIIVTTAVQFYESLFANRTSTCRKLHRLARSIIILDEAQTIPVDSLKPCLRALQELVGNYGCTVVLCTATQPEIGKRPEFAIGLEHVREIIPDPGGLYDALRRVDVHDLGSQTDAELRDRLLAGPRALCIVNTTGHARLMFKAIGPCAGHFHLSARMCPSHRRLRLRQIRRALDADHVCRVVSTQVVEAGVDLDFPVVYRALAGLDSIAQAAGRCNRNGLLPRRGQTFVFRSEHTRADRYFADTAQCAAQVMALHSDDPLSLDAIEQFFKLYYWDQQARWDVRHVLDRFHLVQDQAFPFDFGFATAAREFRIIDDEAKRTVIVPWGRDGRRVCAQLRAMPKLTREVLRKAQRFAVQVRLREWDAHAGRDITLLSDNLGILDSPEIHYDVHTGLDMEARGSGIFMV